MRGKVIWFFGLPSSGKTTLADELVKTFNVRDMRVHRLDGDELRKKFTKDLGFSVKDRFENIRRAGYLAEALAKHGINVIASFVTPLRAYRLFLERILGRDIIFIECHCSIEVCMRRDVKGLYEDALFGRIDDFTGLTSPYEEGDMDLRHYRVSTQHLTVLGCIREIKVYLQQNGVF